MIGRLRATPAPLAWLLAAVSACALAWVVVLPPLQGPDEVSHFSYVQRIVERGTIPWEPSGGSDVSYPYSAEVRVAEGTAGFGPLAANVDARPYWTEADERLWSRVDAALPDGSRTDGGTTSALKNPPVYYLYSAIPYGVAHGGSFFDRQMVMRIANIPLLLVALVFVWLVVGELAGRGWPQIVGTAAAALLPQLLNVTATINPDVLLVTEWSAAIWLMLLVLRSGPRPRLVAALLALCVLAGLTHARSIPLIVPALLAVLLAAARERDWGRVRPLPVAAGTGAAYALVVLAWSGLGQGNVREFVSYVWQFYLPRLGFMDPKIGPDDYGFRLGFVDRLYGTLAQLEVVLPTTPERLLWWATLAGLAALVVVLVLRRDAVRRRAPAACVLAMAIFALLLGLHLAAYRAMLGNPLDPIITARYLLPLLPLFGAAVALVARALPPRAAAAFAGLVLAAGVALQFESIGLLLERFYA